MDKRYYFSSWKEMKDSQQSLKFKIRQNMLSGKPFEITPSEQAAIILVKYEYSEVATVIFNEKTSELQIITNQRKV